MTDTNMGRELGWEDEIENDGDEFALLPDGDYPFTVTGFDRERFAGSAKLPACNKAVIHLKIDGGELGSTTIKHNLFLHTKTEGLLCAFFTGIGQRKHGDKLSMNWAEVIGSTGRVKIGTREYLDNGGNPQQINEVKKFYEPESVSPASYTAGAF